LLKLDVELAYNILLCFILALVIGVLEAGYGLDSFGNLIAYTGDDAYNLYFQ
jgi:hypothetical protein